MAMAQCGSGASERAEPTSLVSANGGQELSTGAMGRVLQQRGSDTSESTPSGRCAGGATEMAQCGSEASERAVHGSLRRASRYTLTSGFGSRRSDCVHAAALERGAGGGGWMCLGEAHAPANHDDKCDEKLKLASREQGV
jgi:hypothetical protein